MRACARVAILALLAAIATISPAAWAEPAQCDYNDGGDIYAGDGLEIRQTSHACRWSTGSQTLDRIEIGTNMTNAVGRHNATYWAETDTGDAQPSWCGQTATQCSSVNLTADKKGVELRYAEAADASCRYQFMVLTGSGRSSLSLPDTGVCFDYLTLAP